MKKQDERRNPAAVEDEALPAELVALLMRCGAEVRAADLDLADFANHPDPLEPRGPERRRQAAD